MLSGWDETAIDPGGYKNCKQQLKIALKTQHIGGTMSLIREITRAAHCEQEMPTAADQRDHEKLKTREEAELKPI
jgi:hypothetical protein